jgi:hypothetical protein
LVIADRGWFQSLSALFALTPQRTFGYAALALMLALGTIIGVVQLRQGESAIENQEVAVIPEPAPKTEDSNTSSDGVSEVTATPGASPSVVVAGNPEKRSRQGKRSGGVSAQTVAQVKLLPGERTYLKTIAALDSTIKSNNNRPMRPELRAEYERNLAVVDRALAATRDAAKKNPNDPDAAEFMFNAYQSKVDLLNTVADARLYNRP